MKATTILRAGMLAGIVAALPLAANATTPTPASGTVGPSINDTAAWASTTPYAGATANASCGGASNAACDNFALTIVPHATCNYNVTVSLQPAGGDDWDLEVYAPDGTTVLASSGNAPGALEVATLTNPPAGIYTVAASPFATQLGYAATASMQEVCVDPPPPGNEDIEFYIYVDPANSQGGEPSGGINWNDENPDGQIGGDNGGSIMFVSSLTTLRVEPNDCTAPATYLTDGAWKDISVPNHVVSLDPIGLVDPVTGRYFSDQLAVKSSLLGLSDDNGDSWVLSTTGAPLNPGVDHQTLGTGPFTEPLRSTLIGSGVPDPHVSAGHGVWYASQDIALAQAGFSTDGGLTFGPANPMWTLSDCSGLHGHLKVSPWENSNTLYRGWLYVPNKSCNGQQGVAISEDSGLTWRIAHVPNTTAGEWDPSIGVATDGTVYMGMDQGGAPMASVSLDGGDTWAEPIDVSDGVIRTTSFSTMVAGDGDRAAFGFLGTTTPGSLGTDQNNTAVWDLYIAMTFDRGLSWSITNVTDGDPVQRGVICDQGTTCPSNRNLLDFNDIQMDKRGRPVAFFADGCTGDCVTNPAIVTQNRTATIARLKSPKGLLAAYDAERSGVPDWPLAEAVNDGPTDVTVTWHEPGDGGNDITGYEVRKNGSVIATVPENFRSHTDPNGQLDPPGTYYEVLAVNSVGYSRGPNGTFSPLKADCDNRLFPGGMTDPGPGPCSPLGKKVLDDNANDILTAGNPVAGQPGSAALDMLRLGISQNEDVYGAGNVAFIIDVQSTDVLPPNAYWPLQFELPGDPTPGACDNPPIGEPGFCDAFVRMDTVVGTPLAPRFTYGFGNGVDPATSPGTLAAAQSTAADGKIIIVVPMSALGVSPTDLLHSFKIRARLNVGLVTITPDNMPDSLSGEGSYGVIDPAWSVAANPAGCSNLAPDAIADAATTNACHPVIIDVLANDSDPENDPISITGVTGATMGTAVILETVNGQRVEYRPNPGLTGTESLTYTIEDGNGNSAQGMINIAISGTPDNDGDGVMNSCDNCLTVVNPSQCNANDGPNGDIFGNHCDADLDNNGIVNSFDLNIMRDNFGSTSHPESDLNCNGITNSFDLMMMRNMFGQPPGPSGLPQ
ncbi:MAG: cadherin-like domain-containing protein [Gammaproteobacteria bacterium]|nr:cadherin-like domain-containing protein [Gammaproteobacteria bacterium]